MSKSAILSSSIAKKWWMALTGLFLCLFLVGHLLGNLQLIFSHGEEGKQAFNEYAYFMTHNPLIKVMSYITYLSILFHVVDGFLLTIQNKKARPINYAYNKPNTNSKLPSRYMAILGTVVLVFIATHMANFWWKMKFSSEPFPMHKTFVKDPNSGQEQAILITHSGQYFPAAALEGTPGSLPEMIIKNGTEIYNRELNLKMAEGYKDLHSLVFAFFGHDKTKEAGLPANEYALFAVLGYFLAMLVLAFHLFHGFSSAFQTLGLNHRRYNGIIKNVGVAFALLIPAAFAIIPVLIYMWR